MVSGVSASSFLPQFALGSVTLGAPSSTGANSGTESSDASRLKFAKAFGRLQDAQRKLEIGLGAYRTSTAGKLSTGQSASSLSLNFETTSTVLASVEEVNTKSTDFSPTDPSFAGSSSSDPAVSGTYDGSLGTDTLTVTAQNGGVVGLTAVTFSVTDGNGTEVDTFSVGIGQTNTPQSTAGGLEVALGGGSVESGDSFEIDVFDNLAFSAAGDGAFDGSGGDPGFDEGQAVSAGSLTLNGVSIAVLANDSLNSVAAKISASGAGVTATFDADSDIFSLTAQEPGSNGAIALGSDSSGFFDAAKLSGATPTPGTDSDADKPIEDITPLAAVRSGSFTVNGVAFDLDITTDTLGALVEQINDSGAGVSASLDEDSSTISISSDSGALELDSGETGLFEVLGLSSDSGTTEAKGSKTVFRDRDGLRRNLAELEEAFNDLLATEVTGFGAASINTIRSKLAQGVANGFKNVLDKTGGGDLRSGLGITLRRPKEGTDSLEVSSSGLASALRDDPGNLAALLYSTRSDEGEDGLIATLGTALDENTELLQSLFSDQDLVGLNLDVSA